ncbi:MAG: beta-N-acetylhexosaminidase, partial [Desulfobacterales bacterium]|nr:beta-N-acetylhexosaminidase [Desulfobacterales bacterium]
RGLFYGIQTLFQLLPSECYKNETPLKDWSLPSVKISDKPRFPWRAYMLDSCRHFQTPEFVKRYIDLLAYYKFNVFHWHLTEDEAWRIQIDKYPKLASVGGYPGTDGQEVNGFYTKAQIRDVVAYAKSRHITVMPEFDIPGHVNAALMAYPEFSCSKKPLEMGELGMRSFSSKAGRQALCAGNDHARTFIKEVLDEIMELFDGPIHIGGDERPKGVWEKCDACQKLKTKLGLESMADLQTWMVKDINQYLLSKGRGVHGWAEHIQGGIPEDMFVQAWRGTEAIDAIRKGHKVVNSTNGYVYLDYPASREQKKTHAKWMPVLPIKKIYDFEPVPKEATEKQAELILGVDAPLWTEEVLQDRVDFKTFPRLLAVTEIAWTDAGLKNWPDFQDRMRGHCATMDALGITYDSSLVPAKINIIPQPNQATITKGRFEFQKGMTVSVETKEQACFPRTVGGRLY